MEYLKQAAIHFCEDLFFEAKGNNYLAIVELNSSAYVNCDFTSDIMTLTDHIMQLDAYGGTNINEALEVAQYLLDQVCASNSGNLVTNIVLCSDGLPQSGDYTWDGPYTYDDHYEYYDYANAVYNTATNIKNKGYTIYSLGFFHNLYDLDLTFGRRLMTDIASNDSYYEVTNVDDLEFIFGEISEALVALPYTFRFTGHFVDDDDVEGTCYYSDAFFMEDSRIYNSHLATMSLCFELTTWSRAKGKWRTEGVVLSDQNTRWYNAYDLLVNNLGYSDFYINDAWSREPTKDSIGLVLASKASDHEEDQTIIAVGIRGGGYGQEWASNFTVGKTGEHDGFSQAKTHVLEELQAYITEHNITGNVTLWIVGYSRSGCVANMVGGELVQNTNLLPNVTLQQSDLFVYTFEAPQGAQQPTTARGDYSNIHNIINLNDIVPFVAPASWGFARYNKDHFLPTLATSVNFFAQRNRMLEILREMEGFEKYSIPESYLRCKIHINWSKILPGGEPFIETKYYTAYTNSVLMEGTDFLFDDIIGNRSSYYYDWQVAFRQIMALIKGASFEEMIGEGMSAEEIVEKLLQELTMERLLEIVSPMYAWNFDNQEERIRKVKANLRDFIRDVLDDSDLAGSALFILNLTDSLETLLWNALEGIVKDLANKNTHSLESLVNTLGSITSIFQAHAPEVTLAWLMSQDSYYTPGQKDFSCTHYRIIRINCPVDVEVYNAETGYLEAAIYDDVPQHAENCVLGCYYTEDGEKLLILPSEGSYILHITATDDGTVSYSINEYDLSSGAYTRVIHYNDISISTGETLIGQVPSMSQEELLAQIPNGSSTVYSLQDSDYRELTPDVTLAGEQAAEAIHQVEVFTESDFGFVSGGGSYILGSYAMVTAQVAREEAFDGWYCNDVLVSEDPNYRFAVTEDVRLEARFQPLETYVLSFTVVGDGTVTNQKMLVTPGSQVQLEAIPGEDGKFLRWSAEDGRFDNKKSATTWFTMPDCNVQITAEFSDSGNSLWDVIPPAIFYSLLGVFAFMGIGIAILIIRNQKRRGY